MEDALEPFARRRIREDGAAQPRAVEAAVGGPGPRSERRDDGAMAVGVLAR